MRDLLSCPPQSMFGHRILLNENLVETVEETVVRPWRERLWSWPWRPWEDTKQVTYTKPSMGIFKVPGAFVMHPDAYRKIKDTLGEQRLASPLDRRQS